jgi:hypothetical protein
VNYKFQSPGKDLAPPHGEVIDLLTAIELVDDSVRFEV